MMAADDKDPRQGFALAALWRRKALIIGIVLGTMAFTGVLLAILPPRYTAEAMVALSTRPEQLAATESGPLAVAPLANTVVVTEMDILRSRALATMVVAELGLVKDPEFNSSLKTSGPRYWIRQAIPAWLKSDEPESDAAIRNEVIDAVMDALGIRSDTDSYAIHITFRSEDAEKASRVANAFADIYVREQITTKVAEIKRATGWIGEQIVSLRSQISEANTQVAEFKQDNRLSPLNSDPGLLAAQQMVALNTELSDIDKERADTDTRLAQARAAQARGGDISDLDFAESTMIAQLRTQEATLKTKLADLSSRFNEGHYAVQTTKAQIARLHQDVNAEVGRLIQTMQNRQDQLAKRAAQVRAQMDRIGGAAVASNRTLTEATQKEHEVEARNLLLNTYLQRYNEVANRAEIEKPDARVVSHATAPTEPSHPKKGLVLVVAFTGSTGLACSLAFLMERFRRGFVTTRQVRAELGLATLGVVPEIKDLRAHQSVGDYLLGKPASVYAEALKSAELSVLSGRSGKPKALVVTSSLPGEGKTTFAVGLGRSMARHGLKVVLVDGDLRRPAVAQAAGLRQNGPGFVDVLLGKCTVVEALQTDESSGMRVLPSGSACDDPQLVLGAHAPELLARLAATFDVVLVDTPPTMVASDCALIAQACDAVLYVVAWDRTPRQAVAAGVEHLQELDIEIAGVVLSRVDLDRQKHDGDYVDFCFRYDDYYAK